MSQALQAIVWTTPTEFPGIPCGHDHKAHIEASVCGEETIAAAMEAADFPSGGYGYMVVSDLGMANPDACARLAGAALSAGDLPGMLTEVMRGQLVKARIEQISE